MSKIVTDMDLNIREALSRLEHEQWVEWTKYLVETGDISENRVKIWKKSWKPYRELSEKSRESDRKYADKAIKLLEGWQIM